MNIDASNEYFAQLSLPEPAAQRGGIEESDASPANDDSTAPEAGVQGNKLIAFTSGLARPYKEAVKYSVQIAQATANAQYDQLTNRLEWYAAYSEAMEHAGWVSGTNKLTEYRNANLQINMESVVIELIKLAAGPNAVVVAELANLAITSLKGDTELTQKLQVASTKGRSGAFDILPCLQKDDDVVMYDHAMRFEHSASSGGFWFWSWEIKDVSLQHVANGRTLNFSHYQTVEQAIKEKLGSTSTAFFNNMNLLKPTPGAGPDHG